MSVSEIEEDNEPLPAPIRPSWEVSQPSVRPAPLRPEPPLRPLAAPLPPIPTAPAPLSHADLVQYDLAGNPVVASAPVAAPAASPAPPSPYGYSAGTASWPPPAAGQVSVNHRNTSGELGDVPPEIARLTWNWGAFFFPVLWCRKHGLAAQVQWMRFGLLGIIALRAVLHSVSPAIFIILGVFYGVTYSALRLYYAVKGHPLAWRHRHFTGGIPEYFQVQKAWMWWGFGLSAVWTVIIPVTIFLGVMGAVLSPHHHSLNGASQPLPPFGN